MVDQFILISKVEEEEEEEEIEIHPYLVSLSLYNFQLQTPVGDRTTRHAPNASLKILLVVPHQ